MAQANISIRVDEVSADPFYSAENMARLRASVAQMETTGGVIHEVNLDGEDMD